MVVVVVVANGVQRQRQNKKKLRPRATIIIYYINMNTIKHKTGRNVNRAKPAAEPEAEQPKKSLNKWTNIFAIILGAMLKGYKVDIITEYELYKNPMRIDILVVKLLEDVVIDHTIMRFFRKHNIIEFKGPNDTLNIWSFDKVLSYFHAYISKNRIGFGETTVTFASVRRPVKLFRALEEERGYKIIPSGTDGIYYITIEGRSAAHVPAMQLVVNSELSAKDAGWIKAIRNDWTKEDGVEIVTKAKRAKDPDFLEAVHLLCYANINVLEEVMEMTRAEKKFGQIIDKWAIKTGKAEKWMHKGWQKGAQEGWQKGWRKGALKTAQQLLNFLERGHSIGEARAKFAFA